MVTGRAESRREYVGRGGWRCSGIRGDLVCKGEEFEEDSGGEWEPVQVLPKRSGSCGAVGEEDKSSYGAENRSEWSEMEEWEENVAIVKRDQCEEKDMRLKTAIKEILKCDIEKENITDPVVLPQADCVITAWLLELTCKDKNDYISHLRKITKLLKPGGHLLLLGALNGTYYMVGQERYHIYKNDENSAKQILREEGFIIDHYDDIKTKSVSDLTDSGGVMFIAAHKEK
ncbi:nicotinamide N-methyltransferase-like [Pseudophryne corroboree]|uniref:nicotinamide N-methyltransferase-like n=1 Tax=Pseudophryne corroboree TaxID=495146 RepID=UPI003081A49C